MIYSFWYEVLLHIDFVLAKSLIFADVCLLLNYIPVVWGFMDGQQKWILWALMVAKRLTLQAWKDKHPPFFYYYYYLQWSSDQATFKHISNGHQFCVDTHVRNCRAYISLYVQFKIPKLMATVPTMWIDGLLLYYLVIIVVIYFFLSSHPVLFPSSFFPLINLPIKKILFFLKGGQFYGKIWLGWAEDLWLSRC